MKNSLGVTVLDLQRNRLNSLNLYLKQNLSIYKLG